VLVLFALFLVACSNVVVVQRNAVVATWSQTAPLQVLVGGAETVTLVFTTNDGKPATNFQVLQTSLPSGWTALNSPVSCPSVDTGNGCLLGLRYAPTALGAGTLSVQYAYLDNSGANRSGIATLQYQAVSHDNVVATVSPVGQIAIIAGSSQSVTVQFTTDDGGVAKNFQVTGGLASLPAGWSSANSTFTCATVSTGNGCQLQLTFAPTASGRGTLELDYSYADDAGTQRAGTVDIPYAVTSDNNVLATPSPAGQITAVVGGRNVAVAIGFTTDDGNPATNLQIVAGLASLPGGWSGPTNFGCAAVSVGNGCTLNLNFAPTAIANGSLIFGYSYTSAAGVLKTGSVTIPYTATADNNVVATPSPNGEIEAIVGGTGTTATVTFTTDDGNLARNLTITGGLATLPSGWSVPGATGTPSFACPTLATGSGCQLSLLFSPTAVETGTLQLAFSYDSNAGVAKTGTVSLPYGSSAHNHVVATVAPSGQITAELNQGTQLATITFTSDDGSPVTALTVTAGLQTLPADWTGPASFTCTSAATGNGCALQLQFQPTSATSNGTLTLNYTYVDNAGTPQTGSVALPYTAVPAYLYVVGQSGSIARCAASFTDGSLSGCVVVASGFTAPYGIALSGNFAYVSDSSAGTVSVCPLNNDGTLGPCTIATAPGSNPFTSPFGMAVNGGVLYVLDANGATPVNACTVDPDGTLSNCFTTAWSVPTPFNVADGISIAADANGDTFAYVVDFVGGNLTTCAVATDAELLNCTQSPIGLTPTGVAAFNGNLYVGTGNNVNPNLQCPIAPDGSVNVANCVTTALSVNLARAVGIAFNDGYAYLSGYGGAVGGVYVCPVTPGTGNLDTCVLSDDPLLQYVNQFGIAVH
jgi:hypothetical protein